MPGLADRAKYIGMMFSLVLVSGILPGDVVTAAMLVQINWCQLHTR